MVHDTLNESLKLSLHFGKELLLFNLSLVERGLTRPAKDLL